ncbi:MAG: hypothetical protein IJ301_03985 [Clostridia bacterium]|nr:hypothetical protein [Clostridia bacterium]
MDFEFNGFEIKDNCVSVDDEIVDAILSRYQEQKRLIEDSIKLIVEHEKDVESLHLESEDEAPKEPEHIDFYARLRELNRSER